ncbi:helix-turn-helix domain-containing protein [Altericista sp. CCNU0014]|uniref:helix-turn-helix domain-containing protein n=1 Tax=Altericista sp. CCNU0014 TaxID=3082949 RepID=UPI00385173CB
MSSPTVFDPEQIQKLTELGAHLRSHRTKKGLSLEEIATKTMIQHRFLEAIEKGNLEVLPEPLYVRGFIRRFAEAMGLDGVSLSESFPLGKAHVGSANAKMLGAGSTALRPWHLYVLYLAAVLGAVALLYALFKPADSTSGTVGASRPSPKASVAAAPKKVVAAAKPKPAAPVQAQLNLKADSYLDISVDGKPSYEGVLKTGTARTITAKQSIQISAGNAGGVMLGVNGQPAKLMGKPGEVKDVNLTPSSR